MSLVIVDCALYRDGHAGRGDAQPRPARRAGPQRPQRLRVDGHARAHRDRPGRRRPGLRAPPARRRGRRRSPTSDPSSTSTTATSSPSCGRCPTTRTRRRSRPARSRSSSATTSSSRSGTAPGRSSRRYGTGSRTAPRCSPTARPPSSTPSRTRSSTPTSRLWRELQLDVDEVETSVFGDDIVDDSSRIYNLKREVLEFRRAVLPLVAVIGRLARRPRSCTSPRRAQPVLPRRRRPRAAGVGAAGVDGPAAVEHPAGPRRPGRPPAERGHAQDHGLGGDLRRADADRRHLRHELRAHAGAASGGTATGSPALHARGRIGLYRTFRKAGWL